MQQSQSWTLCKPGFRVKNAAGETVLRIQGPCCLSDCCGVLEFEVLSSDGGQKVGTINKEWSGYVQEKFTNADNFTICFPVDLDVRIKAVLLAACFLIDFMYFEENKKVKDKDRRAAGANTATGMHHGVF